VVAQLRGHVHRFHVSLAAVAALGLVGRLLFVRTEASV
jgi:hypothetical protein